MTKMGLLELRKSIGREEFDHPLLTSVLSSYEAIDQKINELLKAEAIVRVKKGLYIFGPELRLKPICKESLANAIYGPSCISLEYALAFHGLIPERVETITSVTPKRNKQFNTPVGSFTYRYLAADKYPHEIEQVWIDKEHPVLMASPEKALCDYVVLKDLTQITDENSAREFLRSDLRIEEDNLVQLDLRKLIRLNTHYKSESISQIMEVL